MKVSRYKDYTQSVYDKFPDVDKKAIDDVIKHSLGMMTWFASRGMDIYLNHNLDNYWMYFGGISYDPYKLAVRSNRLLIKKRRMLYKLTKQVYSGYMYTCLSDEQYEAYKKGETVCCYLCKIEEETHSVVSRPHIFRVSMAEDPNKWVTKLVDYDMKDAEYMYTYEHKVKNETDN